MATYRVEMSTTGREVWLVDADSPDEARENWAAGSLLNTEVLSSEIESVHVEEDD
jgi:hypothetical protein